MTAAILIAPSSASGPVRGLMDRLASVGVPVTIVDSVSAAVEVAGRYEQLPAILLDLREACADEAHGARAAGDAVRAALDALPRAVPVAVTAGAQPALILACMRAGAGDVVDLLLEGTASARAVVQRVCQRQREREHEAAASAQQRAVIEDLLKDLIRTERRAIDAEDALATSARPAAASAGPEPRAPAVLVVEHDRRVADDLADLLESAGVATFAYVSGEEALRAATALAANGGLDLAVVAARLPGMDGVETVRQLRERFADLPAFLMTSPEDDAAAAAAAALGVAGYVEKPLADVGAVVERLAELARESASRTRESQYVQRIKERHERVLEKYRSLPRLP